MASHPGIRFRANLVFHPELEQMLFGQGWLEKYLQNFAPKPASMPGVY